MTLLRTLLALVLLSAAHSHAQNNTWSKAGRCDAGTFVCDHITVSDLASGDRLLQFTEYAGHYLSYVGTVDSADRTIVDITAAYFDGHPVSSTGQCVLIFKAPSELSEIDCSTPSLTFTVTEGSNEDVK
jgi:hypothetical protein